MVSAQSLWGRPGGVCPLIISVVDISVNDSYPALWPRGYPRSRRPRMPRSDHCRQPGGGPATPSEARYTGGMVEGKPLSTEPTSGWVLYDDACGFCRRWVPYWEETLARRGFGIAPLQSNWVRERLPLADNELAEDLRLLLPSGEHFAGADVYRFCTRRIWWAWPVWLFSVLPLSRNIFEWAYRTFARNRYCVSDACRLPGADAEP